MIIVIAPMIFVIRPCPNVSIISSPLSGPFRYSLNVYLGPPNNLRLICPYVQRLHAPKKLNIIDPKPNVVVYSFIFRFTCLRTYYL